MTKSAYPKDKNSPKPKPKSRNQAGIGGSAALDSGFQSEASDKRCLVTFRATFLLSNASELDRNSNITLLPDAARPTKIVLLQNGRFYGEYKGPNSEILLGCMKLGYRYRAKVVEADDTELTIEVWGEGA